MARDRTTNGALDPADRNRIRSGHAAARYGLDGP
jgi:hypothetical protein